MNSHTSTTFPPTTRIRSIPAPSIGDLKAQLDGISGKVLTETLRDLERDGLVTRHVYAEVPPRVEYELTELGFTLYEPLLALCRWAEEHIAEVLINRQAYDAR
ncbi:winged helix-turn-helix transcriptional regulator [Lentzea albidocapillata]|uniref:Transcriptional regulator, HxlR family n=1 Tax=Lentzea albidocapillata TaxID=40571 RepID=A0A1W2AC81_9PSEU|nr:helix-turn-helix domain-containing protein [Lentzea albidocapillata]SMC58287.1 transcriptional regulator, HxlR family [Lentzea albidocapillata]